MYADSWHGEYFSDEVIRVLKRTAKVFEQAYVRFLDLKKAEALAREAQVEVALERVRAKAPAMYKSEELIGVVDTLRKELTQLNISGLNAATLLLEQENGNVRLLDITQADAYQDGHNSSWDFEFNMYETASEVYFKRMWIKNENIMSSNRMKKKYRHLLNG